MTEPRSTRSGSFDGPTLRRSRSTLSTPTAPKLLGLAVAHTTPQLGGVHHHRNSEIMQLGATAAGGHRMRSARLTPLLVVGVVLWIGCDGSPVTHDTGGTDRARDMATNGDGGADQSNDFTVDAAVDVQPDAPVDRPD